jgi:NitT/TauT family transport system substrate-binding protein
LSLFKSKQLDAVWTVEPWVSRLEMEAGGKVLVEDKDAITTVLVSSVSAVTSQRAVVAKFVAAHKELTEWIKANEAEAKRLAGEEILAETRAAIAPELIDRAWKRITVTSEIAQTSLDGFLKSAQSVGFLRGTPDLSQILERP